MRLRHFIAWGCLVLVGCRSGRVVTQEPSLRGFVAEFEVAIVDARGTLESLQAAASPKARSSEGMADEKQDPPEVQIHNVLQMVVSSAEQLVRSSAGHSAESDMKAILADAQELLKKSQARPNASEALLGLQQLSTKAEAIKGRL